MIFFNFVNSLGAVLVDDELQKITHVVHGKSRLPATVLDVSLQLLICFIHFNRRI